MVQDITIRIARQADIEAVRHVASETWRASYADEIPDADIDHFLASAYSNRALESSIGRLRDGFVVAERHGTVIGYAMAGLNRDGQPELFAIYVLRAYHGIGAGHGLWSAVVEALARQGHKRLCLWVLAANDRACRFYERYGAILTEDREFAVGATMIREARYCVALGRMRPSIDPRSGADC